MGAKETVEVVENVWLYFAALLGALALIYNGLSAGYKIYKAIRSPDEKQNSRLGELERQNKELKMQQAAFAKELEVQKKGYKILLHVNLAMCSHMLDGNHTKQLTEARDELQTFLVERD